MDARQAHEWGLSKSRLLNLWQWYKHELLVYCCIYRMAVKSETWKCVHTRLLLANPVTNRGLQSISLVLICFLEHFVEAPNKGVCIVQVSIYIHLLTTHWHDKAAVVTKTLVK